MASSTLTKTYCQTTNISKRQVGETTYLIHGSHNAIHQLNPVGAVIWDQLAEPKSIDDLIEILHIVFEDIDRNIIARDVKKLIEELVDAKLIIQSQ